MANQFRLSNNLDYLRFVLKRNRRFMILMTSAMLVLYPVLVLTIRMINPQVNVDNLRAFGQVFTLILLIVSALTIPLLTLGYINSKKHLDVYHALPIKHRDLLSINILAAFVLMLIPFTLAWVLGGVVSLSIDFNLLDLGLTWLGSLMIVSSVMSIMIFTLMHTGTSVDGLLYGLVLNFLPILTYGAYIAFSAIVLLGFNGDYIARYIGIVFPIWSIFENVFEFENRLWDHILLNGLYWSILSTILLVLSHIIYAKRRHDKAERPFTNIYFFPTVSAVVSVVLIFLMYAGFYTISEANNQNFFNPLNFIFPFFFTAVIYLVMDVISQRSFKYLYKAMLRYVFIALVGFSLLLTGLASKGFGFITRIPDLEDVTQIAFRFDDYQNFVLPVQLNNNDYMTNQSDFIFTDTKGIAAIHELHRIILNEYKWIDYSNRNYWFYDQGLINTIRAAEGYIQSYEDFPYTVSSFEGSTVYTSITYTLKNGSTISRSYNIPYEWTRIVQEIAYNPSVLRAHASALFVDVRYPYLKNVSLTNAFSHAEVNLNPSLFDLESFRQAYTADFTRLSELGNEAMANPTLGYVKFYQCRMDTLTSECMESKVLVSEKHTDTIRYLETMDKDFPPFGDETDYTFLLFIPDGIDDDFTFYLPIGQNTWIHQWGAYSKTGQYSSTYVELSKEQFEQIKDKTTNIGIFSEASYSLRVGKRVSSIEQNDGQYRQYEFYGNALVLPEFKDEVEMLIRDLPRITITDPYQFMNLKQ